MQNHEVFEDIFTQFGGIHQKKDKKIFEDIFNQIAGTIDETSQDNKNINEINILLIITFNAFINIDPLHYNKNLDTFGNNSEPDLTNFKFNDLFPKILNNKFDLYLIENIDFNNNDEILTKQFIKIALCKYEKENFDESNRELDRKTNNIYNEITKQENKEDLNDLNNKIKFMKISFYFIKKFCDLEETKINYKIIILKYLRKYYINKFNPSNPNTEITEDDFYKNPYITPENIDFQTDENVDATQININQLKQNIQEKNDSLSSDEINEIYPIMSYNNNVEALLTIFLFLHCICFDKIIFIVIRYHNNSEKSKNQLENTLEFSEELRELASISIDDSDKLKEIFLNEITKDENFLKLLKEKLN